MYRLSILGNKQRGTGVNESRRAPKDEGMGERAHLAGVQVHLAERVDGDKDVAHIGVDLAFGVAFLQLIRHCVLRMRWDEDH